MSDNRLHRIRRVNTNIYRVSYPGMPNVGYKYMNDNTIQGNIQNKLIRDSVLPNIFDYQSSYLPDGFQPPDKIPLSSQFEKYSRNYREGVLQSNYLSTIVGQPKVNIFENEKLKQRLLEELQNAPIISGKEQDVINNHLEDSSDEEDSENENIINELTGQGFFDFIKPAIGIFKSLIPGLGSVAKSAVTTIAKNPKIISDAAKAVKETVDVGKDIKKAIVGEKEKPKEEKVITIPRAGSSKSSLIDHYHQMYLDGAISSKAYMTLLQELEAKEERELKEEKEKEKKDKKGTGVKRQYKKKVVTGTGVDDIIKDIEELPQEEMKN